MIVLLCSELGAKKVLFPFFSTVTNDFHYYLCVFLQKKSIKKSNIWAGEVSKIGL